MRIDFKSLLEMIFAMDATAQHYLKSSRKRVLVDRRGTVKPIIDVNIKSRASIECDWWISEAAARINLLRQIRSLMDPTYYLPGIDAVAQVQLGKHARRNLWKHILVLVSCTPPALDQRPKLSEWFHRYFDSNSTVRPDFRLDLWGETPVMERSPATPSRWHRESQISLSGQVGSKHQRWELAPLDAGSYESFGACAAHPAECNS